MKRPQALAVVLAVLTALVLPVSADEADPIEKALQAPQATGLLVTGVAPESQAESVGLVPGDVITAYAGKPTTTLDGLRAAIGEAIGSASVEMAVVKADGSAVTYRLAPGTIGISNLTPVTKGEPVGPLPPKTDVTFDFSALAKGAHDDWYDFQLTGTLGKGGFEHAQVRLAPDGQGGQKLVMRREVAFDGGERFQGVNHMDVTQEVSVTGTPRILTMRFVSPLAGFEATGKVEGQTLHFAWKGDSETAARPLPQDLPAIPSYVVETLACFMPREPGACFHYRVVQDGSGAIGRPTALLAAEAEELQVQGAAVKTFRYEIHQLGGSIVSRFWVDEARHVVRADYGGAQTTRTTKAKALEGLHADIKPRSAGSDR